MITQVVFNVDSALKDKAMKKAKREGMAFSSILKLAIKAYVEDKFNIRLIGDLNARTSRELRQAVKDIKKGKKLSPTFSTLAEMNAWLDN